MAHEDGVFTQLLDTTDNALTQAIDTTDDLSQLSNRQLLQRLVRAQHRLEQIVTQASEYLDQALDGLDQQLQGLQSRLSAEAAELQAAVEALASSEGEHQAVLDAAQRVQATADLVAGLALPSEVTNPDLPAEATVVEPASAAGPESTPEPAADGVPAPGGDVDQSY
jgi:hypothetical protein